MRAHSIASALSIIMMITVLYSTATAVSEILVLRIETTTIVFSSYPKMVIKTPYIYGYEVNTETNEAKLYYADTDTQLASSYKFTVQLSDMFESVIYYTPGYSNTPSIALTTARTLPSGFQIYIHQGGEIYYYIYSLSGLIREGTWDKITPGYSIDGYPVYYTYYIAQQPFQQPVYTSVIYIVVPDDPPRVKIMEWKLQPQVSGSPEGMFVLYGFVINNTMLYGIGGVYTGSALDKLAIIEINLTTPHIVNEYITNETTISGDWLFIPPNILIAGDTVYIYKKQSNNYVITKYIIPSYEYKGDPIYWINDTVFTQLRYSYGAGYITFQADMETGNITLIDGSTAYRIDHRTGYLYIFHPVYYKTNFLYIYKYPLELGYKYIKNLSAPAYTKTTINTTLQIKNIPATTSNRYMSKLSYSTINEFISVTHGYIDYIYGNLGGELLVEKDNTSTTMYYTSTAGLLLALIPIIHYMKNRKLER